MFSLQKQKLSVFDVIPSVESITTPETHIDDVDETEQDLQELFATTKDELVDLDTEIERLMEDS